MIATAKFRGHGASVLCLDVFSPSSQSQSQSSPSSSQPSNHTPFSSSTSALLLSGSEDGTARLWDLRDHRRRACLCIRVPGGGDVLSAVFSPPAVAATSASASAAAMQASTSTIRRESDAFSRDCSVYLGVDNTVLEYDLRHAESPIICSEPTRDWGRVLQNQDEVNQIGLVYYNKNRNRNNNSGTTKKKKNQKKNGNSSSIKKRQQQSSAAEDATVDGSLYLAACDDAGKARWTEVRSSPSSSSHEPDEASSTILHHDNHGVAIVPACAFRPSSRMISSSHKRGGGGGGGGGTSLEFVTGGTDCKIQLWDIFRPKKPISTFAINQNTNDDGQSKPQVCNPPFVYSLAWSKDGTSLSAGLGDGTVGVFEINNRTLVQSELLRGSEGADGTMHFAHESSVASVVYPSFSAPTSSRILCSAGSDGAVVFWDLGKPPNDEDWTDDIETVTTTRKKNHDTYSDDAVAQLFPHGLLQNLRNTHAAESLNTTSGTPLGYKPRILFDIPHGEKINWVTPAAPSSGTASSEYSDTIFVADTSSDITSYTIPL